MGTGHRSRRRRRSADAASRPAVEQQPWAELRNPYPPFEIASDEQIAAIDHAAMRILDELGLEFQNDDALELLAEHGARVDFASGMVTFPAELIRAWVAKAPSRFRMHARNPARSVTIGGNYINFSPVGGPPYISDLRHGRRPGTYADQCNLIRLAQSLNVLHLGGSMPVEAMDLAADSRHLDYYYAQLTLNDRAFYARAIGARRVEDAVAMVAIARDVPRERLIEEPGLLATINVNSPRIVDKEMLGGLMAMARWGQPCQITPFTLAGAMSPVTLAGALAQQVAEALGVIALAQMVRPGCPVVMGGFTSNVDMKSGSPAFGTPEYAQCVLIGGQLARHFRLPYRSSNVNASNVPDAQATWESAMSSWAAVMAHANIVFHATGWLEGGLCASMEKYIIDAELLQGLGAMLRPPEFSDADFAFDAMREVGPGGHFFSVDHTLARYKHAFYKPMLSDWRNFEQWQESGGKTATERACETWEALLAGYEQPPIDEDRGRALQHYIERRKSEIAAQGL